MLELDVYFEKQNVGGIKYENNYSDTPSTSKLENTEEGNLSVASLFEFVF